MQTYDLGSDSQKRRGMNEHHFCFCGLPEGQPGSIPSTVLWLLKYGMVCSSLAEPVLDCGMETVLAAQSRVNYFSLFQCFCGLSIELMKSFSL